MKTQFLKLRFPDEDPFNLYTCSGENSIGPLSLINLFIGQNNSGKSRLLRSLFINNDLEYQTNEYNNKDFINLIMENEKEFKSIFISNINSNLIYWLLTRG